MEELFLSKNKMFFAMVVRRRIFGSGRLLDIKKF